MQIRGQNFRTLIPYISETTEANMGMYVYTHLYLPEAGLSTDDAFRVI